MDFSFYDSNTCYFVKYNNNIIGKIHYRIYTPQQILNELNIHVDNNMIFIHDVFISYNYRKEKLFTKLMNYVLSKFEYDYILKAIPDNLEYMNSDTLINIYKKFGFEILSDNILIYKNKNK